MISLCFDFVSVNLGWQCCQDPWQEVITATPNCITFSPGFHSLLGPHISHSFWMLMPLTLFSGLNLRLLSPDSKLQDSPEMASSWIRGGSDCILGKVSLLKEWSRIGTGCPVMWLFHNPWRCSKKRVDMTLQDMVWQAQWCWVGCNDLKSLFQPQWFYSSMIPWQNLA